MVAINNLWLRRDFMGVKTMHNNRILGAAIAAALSLQVGVAPALGLDNVNSGTHAGANCVNAKQVSVCVLGNDNVPHSSFDNVTNGNALVNVPSGGIVYAKELFDGDGPPKLPNSDTKMAAVIYTLSTLTDITQQLNVTVTLSDGVFASKPKLAISDTDGNFTSLLLDITGSVGDNSFTFLVDATTTKPLKDGDQLMLVYQFQKAASLAGDNGKVELKVEVKDKDTGGIVNPTRTVTVATSKQAVTSELKSEDSGNIKISVSDDSKKFIGDNGAFVNATTAQIGFLKITNVGGAYESDGETLFKIGEGSDGKIKPGSDAEGSKLTITSGQFAASRSSGSRVYINDTPEVTANSNDVSDTTATFNLDDASVAQMSDKDALGIRIAVDGTTVIGPTSTEENPPKAQLTIDFDQDYVRYLGSTDSVDLRQIYQDGTVCMVYNVPNAQVPLEKINIRVTNDSNVDGALSGKMYKENGGMIGTPQSLGDVAKGQTVVFNATDLEAKFGTWDGRALLEITSTLPSLEVLALMRNQNDRGLLTNLSLGATGSACNNN
jgi:hypothetical protein